MTATETYYLRKIAELEADLAMRTRMVANLAEEVVALNERLGRRVVPLTISGKATISIDGKVIEGVFADIKPGQFSVYPSEDQP